MKEYVYLKMLASLDSSNSTALNYFVPQSDSILQLTSECREAYNKRVGGRTIMIKINYLCIGLQGNSSIISRELQSYTSLMQYYKDFTGRTYT